MLIDSPRITVADRAVWEEQEIADAIGAQSKTLARKWSVCQEYVREFLSHGPAWAGVSWGKDSVVLAFLLMQVAPKTPLRYMRVEPVCNPDCLSVRDEFLRRYPTCDYDEAVVTLSCDDNGGLRTTGRLEEASKIIQKKLGPRRISGVRSEESAVRLMRTLWFGIHTANTSAPLSHLKTSEVFALLYRDQLPAHPAYAMCGGGRWPRQHLRVATLGGERGNQFGRAEWEQEYYGAELRRIACMR